MSNNSRRGQTVDIPITMMASSTPTVEEARRLLGQMLPHLETAIRTSTLGGGNPVMCIYTESSMGRIVSAQFGAVIFVANLKKLLEATDEGGGSSIILPGS